MKRRSLAAWLAATALLTACSTPPTRPVVPATPTPPTVPAPAVSSLAPAQPAPVAKPPPDVWQRLRASFVMADCIAPAVRRAQRETRYPRGFEKQLKRALPAIDYVQRQVQAQDIAGEFALLPWVESHFREVAPRRHRAAGMWQIMPITARALDLKVTRGYDARLDKTVSTPAALGLLRKYHQRWHDWRLADMAYNTGASRMRRILRAHGMPPATPVIPDLPVSRITRQHLTRLLAIACIVRQPERFHVTLPSLPDEARLQAVTLPVPTNLKQVARLAGLSWKQLHTLNAGYRGHITPANSPRTLLLPAAAADTLQQAIAAGKLTDRSRVAKAHDGAGPMGIPNNYTVVAGDSLWKIAHHYGLDVGQLLQWNGLDQDSLLQPGQVLWLGPPG